tara:strand:+ start:1922 stop:3010 length:1089 start_codon:yes stop_codon:yes gene_type:complete
MADLDSVEAEASGKRKRNEDDVQDDAESASRPTSHVPLYQYKLVDRKRKEGFQWFTYTPNDKREYHCNICMQTFGKERIHSSRMLKHILSQRHTACLRTQTISQMFAAGGNKQVFHEDFVAHLLSNNIPLNRIEDLFNTPFVGALVARRENSVLSSTSYRRRYVDLSFERWRATILTKIGNAPFSLLTDESSKNNRKVLNTILVTWNSTFLIDTKVYVGDDVIDGEHVCNYIISLMEELKLEPSKLVGITRDNASYMTKSLDLIRAKTDYSHVLSVSCLSHGLSLVVKAFLEPHHNIRDVLFSTLKKLFSKPSARRSRANRKLPGLLNAVQVSQTRWGGWLEAISFVHFNTAKILVIIIYDL